MTAYLLEAHQRVLAFGSRMLSLERVQQLPIMPQLPTEEENLHSGGAGTIELIEDE